MPTGKKTVHKIDSAYMQHYDAQKERQQRRRKRLMRRLILFSIIVFLAVGSMATYHFKQRNLHAEKQAEHDELQEQLSLLEEQEENLLEEISLLKNDEYVLDIARTNYFFSKEGELIFKIFEEEPSY